jgi:DMSO/TMAO reductase YedYZ molybdopterin-dependent catalytic subunit
MSLISRRRLITGGVATAAGASGLAIAARLASRYGLIPPDHGGIYAPGETLTYAAQRILTRHSMAREFPRSLISKKPFANGGPLQQENYVRSQAAAFADWLLHLDGMVARPISFSLADLRKFPSRSQITHIACEEGWSYIAEWTGVPLSLLLDAAGTRPDAKFVAYYSLEKGWMDSIDMGDALHPQTLVTYGMNGGDLPAVHGGPLRLRVPRQLGYKSQKYLMRLTVTDDLNKLGREISDPSPEYAWYAGI